jgi:hypothetical protein
MRKRNNPGHVHYLADLAESGAGDFKDYYPESAAGELETEGYMLYYGRNVIWMGFEGEMIRVDPEYMTHLSGNIFYEDKLAAVVDGIRKSRDRVIFRAPWGNVAIIDVTDVTESQQNWEEEGIERPLTTGDDELDRWLVTPEEFDRSETREMKRMLREAVREGSGDLGSFRYNIRDGNHRAFGAVIAGEPYIYMRVEDNQMQDLRDPTQRRGKVNKAIRAQLE